MMKKVSNDEKVPLHLLGPEIIAEILTEYDILYEKLLKIPLTSWKNQDLKDTLHKSKNIEVLEDMKDIYIYACQEEKIDVVNTWIKLTTNV